MNLQRFFLTSSLYLLHFTSDLFQFAHKAFLLCQIYNSMIHVMMFDTRCLAVVVFLHSVTYSRQLFVILNINVRLLFNNFLLLREFKSKRIAPYSILTCNNASKVSFSVALKSAAILKFWQTISNLQGDGVGEGGRIKIFLYLQYSRIFPPVRRRDPI